MNSKNYREGDNSFVYIGNMARVHSPDKTQLRQDLETTQTGVYFTLTSRELISTRLEFTPKKRDSPNNCFRITISPA